MDTLFNFDLATNADVDAWLDSLVGSALAPPLRTAPLQASTTAVPSHRCVRWV